MIDISKQINRLDYHHHCHHHLYDDKYNPPPPHHHHPHNHHCHHVTCKLLLVSMEVLKKSINKSCKAQSSISWTAVPTIVNQSDFDLKPLSTTVTM